MLVVFCSTSFNCHQAHYFWFTLVVWKFSWHYVTFFLCVSHSVFQPGSRLLASFSHLIFMIFRKSSWLNLRSSLFCLIGHCSMWQAMLALKTFCLTLWLYKWCNSKVLSIRIMIGSVELTNWVLLTVRRTTGALQGSQCYFLWQPDNYANTLLPFSQDSSMFTRHMVSSHGQNFDVADKASIIFFEYNALLLSFDGYPVHYRDLWKWSRQKIYSNVTFARNLSQASSTFEARSISFEFQLVSFRIVLRKCGIMTKVWSKQLIIYTSSIVIWPAFNFRNSHRSAVFLFQIIEDENCIFMLNANSNILLLIVLHELCSSYRTLDRYLLFSHYLIAAQCFLCMLPFFLHTVMLSGLHCDMPWFHSAFGS